MRTHLFRFAAAAALAALSSLAAANPVKLVGLDPFSTTKPQGITVYDGGGGPYSQAFDAPANATLDKIVWWGYRGEGDSDLDEFEVAIGGEAIAGSLEIALDGSILKYTLDVQEVPLAPGAGVLTIFNNQNTFEWFWQGATDVPYLPNDPFPVAFSLLGTLQVPEPGSLSLAGLAGLMLAVTAARRRRGG